MLQLDKRNINRLSFRFVAIFEERVEYKRIYTLPFNTLTAVIDDGGSDGAVIENLRTGETLPRRRGDLISTPVNLPMLIHANMTLHTLSVHFKYELYPGMDIFDACRECIAEHDPAAVAELERVFRIPDTLRSLSAIQEFVLRYCNSHWPERVTDNAALRRFRPVMDFVRGGVTAQTTVEQLADMMSMRLDAFSREFTAVFRKNAKDFIQDELILKATTLLTRPDGSVRDTADRLGFSSQFYFSKFFKRRIGCPPSLYRQRFRLGTNPKEP